MQKTSVLNLYDQKPNYEMTIGVSIKIFSIFDCVKLGIDLKLYQLDHGRAKLNSIILVYNISIIA